MDNQGKKPRSEVVRDLIYVFGAFILIGVIIFVEMRT